MFLRYQVERLAFVAAWAPTQACSGKPAPRTLRESPRDGTRLRRKSHEAAFSLLELLMVVAIVGALSAMVLPRLVVARHAAVERSVVGNLKTMATNQQFFYRNPVPLMPSSLTDKSPRFATLKELNSYSTNLFGDTVSTYFVDAPGLRYSMVPLNPNIASLRGRFLIQVTEQDVAKGFIYQVDESGRVVKIR